MHEQKKKKALLPPNVNLKETKDSFTCNDDDNNNNSSKLPLLTIALLISLTERPIHATNNN